MPKMIVVGSVVVIREDESGKNRRKVPEIGKSFDFSKEEIETILRQNPSALRKAVNETADEPEGKAPEGDGKGSDAQSSPEGAKAKVATANKGKKAAAKAKAEVREDTAKGTGGEAAEDDDTDADEDEDI